MAEGSIIALRSEPAPSTWLEANWEIGLLIAVAVGFIIYRLITYLPEGSSKPSAGTQSKAERHFRNVFAIMDDFRRQSLISHYMQKHGCGREEAMRMAVDDRTREQQRYG